jgi:outer membrane protein assembly factor BamD (BamD/ComL family)
MRNNSSCSIIAVFCLALLFPACATAPSAPAAKPARQQAKQVDAKAQREYYDRGLQSYSQENYRDAREAFQQAVEYGPNTAVGMKAKENLKKTEQILKTLEELEKK